MASFTKHPSGWRAFVFKNGVRATKVCPSKKEAQTWATAKEAELLHHQDDEGHTFGEAVERYRTQISPKKKGWAWESRRFNLLLTQIKPETPLSAIGTKLMGEWRDKRLQTVSGATVRREAILLSGIFTKAVNEWKWMTIHPLKGVTMPPLADPRHQVWRWQQMKRVLRAPHVGQCDELIKAFRIALHTGLRLSEILAGTYDANRKVFVLKRSKTTGYVEVPLTKRALKCFPQEFTLKSASVGSSKFSEMRKELMIKGLTFHDTRGTALTLLSRKMDVLTLARISRHKDLRVLMNVYYRETAESISARI